MNNTLAAASTQSNVDGRRLLGSPPARVLDAATLALGQLGRSRAAGARKPDS
jgi:hypothetical protein